MLFISAKHALATRPQDNFSFLNDLALLPRMTRSPFVQVMENSVTKLRWLAESVRSTTYHPTKKHYQALESLSLEFTQAAKEVLDEIPVLGGRYPVTLNATGQRIIAQLESDRTQVVSTGKLKNRGRFIKNITLSFNGPWVSGIDDEPTVSKKEVVRQRCKRICALHYDGLISWAFMLPPSNWAPSII